MIFLRRFYEFFKVGLFSVGGGLATLPFLRHLGEVTGWFSAADLANMVAVSESTPGAMGINTGFRKAGLRWEAAGAMPFPPPPVRKEGVSMYHKTIKKG